MMYVTDEHPKITLSEFKFENTDVLLFGREDNGLPTQIQKNCDHVLNIPMPGGVVINENCGVRSLNLSVACGIAIYTVFDQLNLLSTKFH